MDVRTPTPPVVWAWVWAQIISKKHRCSDQALGHQDAVKRVGVEVLLEMLQEVLALLELLGVAVGHFFTALTFT